MAKGYTAKINEASKELTAREKLLFSDFSNAKSIADLCADGCDCTIKPAGYVVVEIHNEKAQDGKKDYVKYMIWDTEMNLYRTSSENLFDSFITIWNIMADEDEEYAVRFYQVESKNYRGKYFLTCSIV